MYFDKLSIAIIRSMKSIAIRIREARKLRNISQRELSEMVEVTASAVSQYETSQSEPSIKNLARIAVALDVSFEWLATGRGEKEIEEFLHNLASNYKKDNRLILLNDDRAEWLDLYEGLPEDWQAKYKYVLKLTANSLNEENK